MNYTKQDFESDKKNPDMPHIQSKERYVSFYEQLGLGKKQPRQCVNTELVRFIKPVGNILELGCHAAHNVIYYAQRGFNVIGVEISSTILDIAYSRYRELPDDVRQRIHLIQSDIMDLDCMGKFDTLILTDVLEHVIDPFEVLKKSTEFMLSTSKIYITAPSIRIGNYAHVRGITEEWLEEAGEKIGLDFEFDSIVYYPKIHNKRKVTKTRAIGMLK
jgi:2-polyprenyl-3-methyl-5-hydroxy-6-metoxy-1,4-benzoquinol methylase